MNGDLDWLYIDTDEVDLSQYRDAVHKHNLMSPLYYREALVKHFEDDPNERGLQLPWSSMEGVRIREGEVSLWSGANFAGKSALITQNMTNWLRGSDNTGAKKEKALLISPEFSPTLNLSRIVQQVIGKTPGKISEADVTAVLAWLEGRLLIYDAIGQVDIDDLMAVMYYARAEHACTQAIIDNLTVMKLPSADVNQSQGELMTSLVQTARQTGLHIHVICHTRKPSPGEQVSRYQIRGSSMLSDLADNIFLVERNESKERKLADISLTDEERVEVRRQSDTRLHLLKQRHGSSWIGVARLYFSPTSLRWYSDQKFIDRPFREVVPMAELGGPVTAGTV